MTVDAPIVELDVVDRTYGEDPPVHALREATLAIAPGEWLAVVGPSGSGKSTLLNILGLLDRPTAGRYRLAGADTGPLTDRERAGLRSRMIGFVFQSFHLMTHRPVIENVMLADIYRKGSRRDRHERARAALERVRLDNRAMYSPSRLSGGERQRVAIARAILGRPQLLLCDEPTGNLDSATGNAILELFGEMHRDGLTIVMITHDPAVAQWAQRQASIIDGQLELISRVPHSGRPSTADEFVDDMQSKICSRCGLEKPMSAFYRRARSGDGRQSYCIPCSAIYKAQRGHA